jgi:hypothetical protein
MNNINLPENLEKVLDDNNTDTLFKEIFCEDFLVNKKKYCYDFSVINQDEDPFSLYPSQKYQSQILNQFSKIAYLIGESITGFKHSSDILDDASHEEYSSFSKDFRELKQHTDNSRFDFYDDVKENVKNKIENGLQTVSIKKYPAFLKVIDILNENGKSNITDPEYLQYIIINSRMFQELVKDCVTGYGG